MSSFFLARRLFDGERFQQNVVFHVADGRLHFPADAEMAEVEVLQGTVVPGFIDVQVNGGGGAFFNAEQSPECLAAIAKAHARFGTTALMPTLITDNIEVMQRAADATAQAIERGVPGILGIHFEGPHLSIPKKGTHSERLIRDVAENEFALYERRDLGLKMVTLAPEQVSADDIRRLVEAGVKVSIGHTNADFATTERALAAGADGFTHLFNAMSPFTSREPGVVGAALWDEQSWCGLILDGHHVHPVSARLALRTKARGKIMLVTDAMPPVGTDDTEFDFFDGRKVYRDGDRLTSSTGELAGSVLDMASAVRNCMQTLGQSEGESEGESLRMASLYPAEYLGIADHKGRLVEGYDADFVVLDEQSQVSATYIAGEKI